jgi:hypothetical protein
VKPRKLNAGPYHLSRILSGEYARSLDDSFPHAQLFEINMVDGYFIDIIQFPITGMAPSEMAVAQKKK